MATAEKAPKIYEAISNVMKDVGVVGKDSTNDFDHYKFRGIDAVMNALNPAMIKNRIFVTPTVVDSLREERAGKNGTPMMYTILTVKYTFYTDDGSNVECVVVGEAMDRSDKSTNKAMSAAFKYACFQTFCIPTEEMLDADSESPEIGEKTAEQPKKATKTAKTSKKEDSFTGMNPPEKSDEEKNAEMKAGVNQDLIPVPGELISEAQLKQMHSEMNRTGVSEQQILDLAKVDKLEAMNQETACAIISKLGRTRNKT